MTDGSSSPAPPPAAAARRRVRTGCLTCRTRRRKCDEGKPRCANCITKSLVCRYGTNITFVNSGPTGRSRVARPRHQTYARVQFVDEDSSSQLDASENNAISPNLPHAELTGTRLGDRSSPGSGFTPIQKPDSLDWAAAGSALPAPPKSWVPQPMTARTAEVFDIATAISGTVHGAEQGDVDLLRYYRYQVAPSLDLGDPDSFFGTRSLIISPSSLAVYHALLAVASCHRSLLGLGPRESDEVSSLSSAAQAEEYISALDDGHAGTSCALLLVRNILISEPRHWQQRVNDLVVQVERYGITLDENHLRLVSRISLAATLMGAQSILPASHVTNISSTSYGVYYSGSPSSSWNHFQQSISLLDRTVNLTQSKHKLSTQPASPPNPTSSIWQTIWSDSQLWYSARPESMQQLFSLFEPEMSHLLTAEAPSSFPVILFTSASATLANVIHHLTALLLLQHRPRLLKPTASANSSVSPIWHAQCIAGIATRSSGGSSNDDEGGEIGGVWGDPLMVAAVLHAAKLLSHDKQLEALVAVLHEAQRVGGWKLESELAKLQSIWRIARDV